MTEEQAREWLDRYGRAWETKDPKAVVELFTEDATYRETPFDEVMKGRDAIADYWQEIPDTQKDIGFSYEILSVQEDRVFATWHSKYARVRNDSRVELDGIFVLDFASDGLCRSLLEWWHLHEDAEASGSLVGSGDDAEQEVSMSDRDKEELLSDPTGGPTAQNIEGDQKDADVDASAGASGQDEGEGAVEEARESTGSDKPTPG